ncbi:diacylglycerol kinase [Thermoleophilia bacterium SCSIO 60948]|nr:diacylglycerol kinase [Thermoleophilia bacterium SCSIO 60948]
MPPPHRPATVRVPPTRRLAALAALVLPAAVLVFATAVLVGEFPRVLVIVALLLIVVLSCWYGLLRRGAARAAGLGVGLVAMGALATVLIGGDDHGGVALLIVLGLGLAAAAARTALAYRAPLPGVPPPARPVLFLNPRSGGGKSTRFRLAQEARARGIDPIELEPGADLERLVRSAVGGGADAVAMAGGDGSQAVVARVAAELGLPYACIPAGTRNHFALDLGVDRDDVVGALDAFVDAGERRVDLAEVNGRVFVNNVSLGLYAEAVARDGYRDAKLRTIVDALPDAIGPGGQGGRSLRWHGPGGHVHSTAAAILVSNNRYRLGRAIGSGTRPRIDDGLLGVTVVARREAGEEGGGSRLRPWREWSAPRFEVDADGPIAAGIDGEATTLEPPLRFRTLPGVLRVRISRAHPGASPSARVPEGPLDGARALLRVATGRPPLPVGKHANPGRTHRP